MKIFRKVDWILKICFKTLTSIYSTAPSGGISPEMHAQYSSAKSSSSGAWVTFVGSGQGAWGSGVTLEFDLNIDLVGVQTFALDFSGELPCCASLDLKKRGTWGTQQRHSYTKGIKQTEKDFANIFSKCQKEDLSFLSSALSSCKQSELPVVWPGPKASGMEGGLHGLLRGVDVKQLLGLEFGRSALTGVGLMRRDGLVALNTFRNIIL